MRRKRRAGSGGASKCDDGILGGTTPISPQQDTGGEPIRRPRHHTNPVSLAAELPLRIQNVPDPVIDTHQVQLCLAISGLRNRRPHLLPQRRELAAQL